jgi:amino acid adenylation domain-containing protein
MARLAQQPSTNPELAVSPHHLAYIIYTSGSTGRPKGVAIEHRSISDHCHTIQAFFELTPKDRILQFASLSFDVSVEQILPTLCCGAVLTLPRHGLISPEALSHFIEQYQVTVANLPPAFFEQWLLHISFSLKNSSLRLLPIGGDALSTRLISRWHAVLQEHAKTIRLLNGYGPTETTVTATFYDISQSLAGVLVPIGRPLPRRTTYILDRHLQPVPMGVPGELYIGGAGLARGYLNRPELTAEKFIANPFSEIPGERLYKTGDLVRYRPDGNIEFLGRLDQQVKLRGFRIELGEIEAALAAHPAVREAVVMARGEGAERQLVAYVVAQGSGDVGGQAQPNPAELRSALKVTLPDYMLPAAWVFLPALPLTPNGKVDRKALPEPEDFLSEQEYVAPRTEAEQMLAEIWSQLLDVRLVGIHDNFFAVGGHSLRAVQMVSRIRDRFDIELPVRQTFETPTIAELAANIDLRRQNAESTSTSRLPPIHRFEHEGPLPVSYAQERLWFLDQLEPGNAFYNIPVAFRCTGHLDVDALERSINEVIRRHESLRTTFYQIDGKPFQRIHEHQYIGLARQTLTHLEADQREAEARRLALVEALKPFCLETGPLVRATLIDLAQDDRVLLFTIHHIVADGWSMGVLMREFSQIYPAFARGEPSPLPDLEIQFADFAVWQRAWLDGENLQTEIDFWMRQLQHAPRVLELRTDFPRPAVQTFRGGAQPFYLSREATLRLKSLSQEAGASLFMTLFAGFSVLLHRYTGEEVFLVGSPIANRTQNGIEPLIGFFVNTLALRADLSGDPQFPELLRRVRQTTLDAYAHPNVPFEFLVERLQPTRDMSRNPLVQVSLVFQNTPFPVSQIDDLQLQQMETEVGTARFELEVFLWEENGALRGAFAYFTDLFEAETIARLVGHFETLLTAIADDANRRVSELPLLTDHQRRQLLVDWNATAADFAREKCIHTLFEEQATRSPGAMAVAYGQQSLTYQELDSWANQIARHLQALGAGPDVLVGLCLERSLDMVVSILGILKAGAAYVPLDASYPQDRLAFMIDDARLSLLLTHTNLVQRFPAHNTKLLCLDTAWDQIARESTAKPSSLVGPNNLAYVIYTSGSTGRPKGTLLEHHSVVNYLTWARQAYDVASGAGAPVNSSIGFDATVTSLFTPLITGRRVELLPETDEVEHLCRLLQSKQDFSLVKITPAHLDLLSRLLPEQAFTGQARAFVIGGEALTARQLAFWRNFAPSIRLINEYGPTETVVGCCVYEVPHEGSLPENIPIGRPIANCQLYVLDQHLQPVPVGVPGELYIGGEGVGRGYLKRAELTKERFIRNPFSNQPQSRLYKSGDRVRYLPDGNLEFLGRIDSQVKIRGYRVELGEVESVLAGHAAVDSVVSIVREDQAGDTRLVAYLVLRESWPTEAEKVVEPPTEPEHEQITLWEQVFEDSYSSALAVSDPAFDFAGWKSSYTGEPISTDEMREWVDQTVQRIESYMPRRVWEIGCGTGLLLARLAPNAEKYLGTDFSQAALHRAEQIGKQLDGLAHIQLLPRIADDVTDIAGPFDTIILNSIVQYFPSVEYLLRVLDGAIERLASGGRIFVGDVRSLPLLESFHGSVEASRASNALLLADLKTRVQQQISQEKELLLDPQFFFAMQTRYPSLSHVEVLLKRGHHNNELLRFRYDAVLHFGPTARNPEDIRWCDWQGEQLSLTQLAKLLADQRPDLLALRHVPNARLQGDLCLIQTLHRVPDSLTVNQLREQVARQRGTGVDPEHLWAMAEQLDYGATIAPSDEPGAFDVIFQCRPRNSVQPISFRTHNAPPNPWHRYGSNPIRTKLNQHLNRQLRQLAESKLPEYMVPSAFVILDHWPLTANGKVDRTALPAPDGRSASAAGDFVAPRTPEEEILAAVWADVLGLERVGIEDNFFLLGGHSLLATQVISRVREAFSIELQVRTIFEEPTIAGLARRLIVLRTTAEQTVPPPPIEPQLRGPEIPLSYAQERLWFLDRLEQQSPAYNMPTALRLSGTLNVPALRKCLNEICARHEILRTTFPSTADGEPLQQIGPVLPFDLPLVDLKHLDDDLRSMEIRRWKAEVLQQCFDLAKGPLWRAVLIRLDDHDHILLACMHHIISDGWSMAILVREIVELYTVFSENRPHRLDALPLQYADYGIWQRKWLAGEVLDAQVEYWKTQLHDAPPLLELPTDYPRPAVQSFHGGREQFELDPVLSDALEDLSRQHGVSLYMTLLATFALLLSRYSRMPEVVIGSPIAGRRHREIESLIGFFVNTLALRIDLDGNPSFAELLKRVRKLALDAYAHQDVPFEHLVNILRPERNLSHAPIFQVMFVFQNAPVDALNLTGLTLTPVETESETAKFDLTLCMGKGDQGIWGWVEYRTDLFERATALRMIGQFQNLLRAAVNDPSSPISKLPWISESERRQVLVEWNQTRRHFDRSELAHRQFEFQVQATPNHVAAELGQETLTYSDLNQRANRLAHLLIKQGVQVGSRAGICMSRGFNMLVSVLAVLKTGAAYVPLDSQYPPQRLAFMLEDAQVDVLLTQTDLSDLLPQHSTRIVLVDQEHDNIASHDDRNPDVSVGTDDLAYIMYTSGSTGQPKGIAMRHGALANLIHWQLDVAGFKSARTLQFTSLSFDVSFQEIFSTLCSGGILVLVSEEMRRDSRALLRYLQQQRIERLFVPFVALQQLALSFVEEKIESLPLRHIITAGEQLRITPELATMMGLLADCRLHNHYGPTESHVATAFTLPTAVESWPELPPIGRPIANTEIFILDENMQPMPPGVPGELFISGDCLARGYWNRPDLTRQRFVPNPFTEQPSSRLYRTGDLARCLKDGNIEFLGRCDDQLKIRGFRVEPGEIEAVLAKSPDVAEVVVVAREERPGNRRLVAYIVRRQDAEIDVRDLRELILHALPDYMVPAEFVFLKALPLTPSGKINRRGLPAPKPYEPATDRYVAPRDTTELRLAEIWESVLDCHPVGVKDNFFELGGHSLLAVRVLARVEQAFGVHLPLSILFQSSTVESLAGHLRSPGMASQESCLVRIQPGDSKPPLFCAPGAGGNVIYLFQLARRLGADQPFYGLQALGLSASTQAANRVEDMAAHYVREIRSVQAAGPYFLAGHSFGGMVAFETAQQLRRAGQTVGLLVIFDTNAPQTIERPMEILQRDEARWLCEIATVIEHLSGRKQYVSYDELKALDPEQQLTYLHAKLIRGGWLPTETSLSQLRSFLEVYKANILADYRPRGSLRLPIVLFKAEEQMATAEFEECNEFQEVLRSAWGWKEYADGEVPVYLTPGNHLTMMTEPHVSSLASKLRECLEIHQRAAGYGELG